MMMNNIVNKIVLKPANQISRASLKRYMMQTVFTKRPLRNATQCIHVIVALSRLSL